MPNEEFENIIQNQKEEINKIKDTEEVIDIKSFYLNKYHEMYQEILENRVQELKEEMISLDAEITELTSSAIRIDEDFQNNEINKQKIQEVEDETYVCYAKMEERRFTAETECDELEKASIELFHNHYAHNQEWYKLLDNYLDHLVDNGSLIDNITNLFNWTAEEGYELSLKIKENEHQVKKIHEDLEVELSQIRNELEALLREKKRYEDHIYEVSAEHQQNVKQDLEVRLEHKKNYEKEIVEAYKEASVKQLKELNELIIKFNLIRKEPSEQIEELDQLLEKFKSKLLSLDTKSNQEYQRQKRLSSLTLQKKSLEELKEKKANLDKKIAQLQNAYVVVVNNIKELDEHLEDIEDQIAGVKFQSFLRFEEQFQKELRDALNTIKNKQKFIESLKEDRTYNLFDPDPEKLKNLDNLIHENELELNTMIKNYDSVKEDYESFLAQNDNQQIKTLMEDGKFFEENNPKLKELAIKLKEKISKLQEDSAKLAEDTKDYQNIIMQIGELQSED